MSESAQNSRTYPKIATAACFGTFLEWYDFLTFATLAVAFAPLFFPSSDPITSLLASLATFGAGMVVRPLGAAFFGSLGDRIGRRPVFLITISLMGGATFAVGFLPTYDQIGILAPILLVSLRLLQGLSAGGEIGGSAVYLTEHAGYSNRGFKTSVLQLMGPLGMLVSTLQLLLLNQFLDPASFKEWGWRVPFWFSIVLLLVALKVRMTLEETPIFKNILAKGETSKSPLRDNFKDKETRKQMFLLFFCISAGGSVLFFCVQVYTGIFMKSALQMNPQIVDTLTITATLVLFPLIILSGALSDRIGRRPVVISGLLLGMILIQPAYQLLHTLSQQTVPDYFLMSVVLIAITLPLALVVGPQTALLAELFPARTRNSAATLPHNLAAGWIGGMLPLIVTWLNKEFSSQLAGLWYPTIFLAIAAGLAIFFLPETKTIDLTK
jgi:MFS family permease